jgi:hypothetical protein
MGFSGGGSRVVLDSNMIAYAEEEVTSLIPAKAFEMSITSHQMNNNELNEFKPSFNQREAANRIIIILHLIQNLLEYNTQHLSKGKSDGLKLTEPRKELRDIYMTTARLILLVRIVSVISSRYCIKSRNISARFERSPDYYTYCPLYLI